MEYFKVTSRALVTILTLAVVFSSMAILLGSAPSGTGNTGSRMREADTSEETYGFYGSEAMEGIPEQIILGDKQMQFLGTEVKVGDINGDGVDDIVTNLENYDTGLNAVVVFFGNTLTRYYTPSTADVAFTGPSLDDYGYYFTLGDFNGDGRVDIAISSFGTPSAVYIYLNTGTWSGTYNTSSADAVLYGAAWGEIGYLLQNGDVNGDGKDDLVMIEDNVNGFQQVYVLYGRDSFAPTYLINASEYDVRVNSTIPLLGGSILWNMYDLDVVDVTGDGYDDLLIGCPVSYKSSWDGVVMLLPGGLYMPKNIDLKTYPHFEFRGYSDYLMYGVSHGDFNGDGQNDVMVWSPYAFHDYGGAFIFYTTSYNVVGNTTLLNADLIVRGPSDMGSLNFMGIEDLDGDGKSEIMVGSEDFNSGSGGLYIIYRNEFDNLLDNVYEMMFLTPGFSLSGPGSNSYLGADLKSNVVFTDFNNDGIMELTVGTPGVKNNLDEQKPQYAGGVYILHQLETTFEIRDFNITNQHEVRGVNILGADYPYTITFKVYNSWDRSDVHGLTMVFSFSGSMSGESITLSWTPSTMEIRKGPDLGHYFELISSESGAVNNNTWYFNITFVLTHNITSEDPITIGISARGGIDMIAAYHPPGTYRLEKDLVLIGDLVVRGEDNGVISNGEFLHPNEMVEVTGLKCVYEGTEDFYPLDSYFDVELYDNYGNIYYDVDSSGREIYLRYWVLGSSVLEYFNITVTNIPGGGQYTSDPYPFYYYVDSTPPDPPLYITAKADSEVDPLEGYDNDGEMYLSWEPVTDTGSGIYGYFYSTIDGSGTMNGNFTTETSAVITGLKEGWNDIYVWSVDNAMNIGEANKIRVLIDKEDVIFSNPTPGPDDWVNTKFVRYRITVVDPEGSGVEGRSIEYALSYDGGRTFGAWEPANVKRNSPVITVTVFLNLREGKMNAIKWRAKDIAGNGPVESPVYRIQVDTLPITFKDPIPNAPSESKYVVLGITITDRRGSGVDGSTIQYQISRGGAANYGEWRSLEVYESGETITVRTPPILFEKGTTNYVRWRAKDVAGNGYTYSEDVKIYILPEKINHKPVIVISSPSENMRYLSGRPIKFDASATYDPDGQELSFLWFSSIDGFLGTDPVITKTLSPGTHTITLAVSDGIANVTKTLTITVNLDLAYLDTDGDGIPDIYDDDDDGDGLLDVEEDKNHNGLVDPGETNPKLPDTDGDGISDKLDPAPLNPAYFKLERDPNMVSIWFLIIIIVIITALLGFIGYLYKVKAKKDLEREKMLREVVRRKKALRRFELLTGIPLADLPAVESIYPSLPGVVQATAITALPPGQVPTPTTAPPEEGVVKEEKKELPEVKVRCPICDTEVTIPEGEERAICPLCGEEVKRG